MYVALPLQLRDTGSLMILRDYCPLQSKQLYKYRTLKIVDNYSERITRETCRFGRQE